MADIIGAGVINIPGGGGYGEKTTDLARLQENIKGLPDSLRFRLTLENDDRTYTQKIFCLYAQMIDPDDFPQCWQSKTITLDIETKEKEMAIEGLQATFK